MKRIIGIAAVTSILSACATAPAPVATYEPASSVNAAGYLTAPAENGRYVVAYTGAKGMSREKVAQYALLRAAEFTAESGQEWFAVINTKSQNVVLAAGKDDLKGRSGGFIDGAGGASTGSGGTGGAVSRGTVDSNTSGGASTGGFGGGAPPTQVLERWTPPMVPQTVIIIQMGTGEQAKFAGVDKAPEIFSAKTTAADIRAKMTP